MDENINGKIRSKNSCQASSRSKKFIESGFSYKVKNGKYIRMVTRLNNFYLNISPRSKVNSTLLQRPTSIFFPKMGN